MAKPYNKDNVLPRAVAYLRFAVADVSDTKIATAKYICQRRANELGSVLVSVYIDNAPNWTDDRPQLKRMLSDLVETGEITYVIVPEHSTVAHDMQVYGRICWKVEQAGARLIAATVPLKRYRTRTTSPHDNDRGRGHE
jgi:DNA invertase Pin-like site-specific DNA recombinase